MFPKRIMYSWNFFSQTGLYIVYVWADDFWLFLIKMASLSDFLNLLKRPISSDVKLNC